MHTARITSNYFLCISLFMFGCLFICNCLCMFSYCPYLFVRSAVHTYSIGYIQLSMHIELFMHIALDI